MSEPKDFSAVVFPPTLEAKIQKMVENTSGTRDEVIQGLMVKFFDKVDLPSENIPAFALLVKRAMRELNSGG